VLSPPSHAIRVNRVRSRFLLTLLLSPAALEAQTGTVAGRVSSAEGVPRPGASLLVVGTTRGAIADTVGRFVITHVPAGDWKLRARSMGAAQSEVPVSVRVGETTHVELTLVAAPTTLGAVRTEARGPDRVAFLSRPSVATTSISARAIEAVPRLGEPDIIRIVQLLPGVAARNDFSTGFNVRGGEADQNLILIDGYPIYNPFHLGGLFSTFMDATVRDATLMTGGFPARYGGRLSSVLDVRSSIEERPGLHGSGEISLLGATAAFAGPLPAGSWLVAARRTYADKVVDAFSDEVLPYHFKDLHSHVTVGLPGDVRLSLTGYGGHDELNADLSEAQDDSASASASEGSFLFAWGNSVAGGTLSKSVPYAFTADSVRGELRVSRSRFSTVADAGEGSATVRNHVIDWRVGGTLSLHAPSHDLALGAEHSALRASIVEGSPQTGAGRVARVQQGAVIGVFVDDMWRVSSRLLVQGGVRYEHVSTRDWHAVSPRLSVKYFVTPDLALTAATGRFTQWTHSLGREDTAIRLFDFWVMSDSTTPVATATHGVLGAEAWLGASRQVRAEVFLKRYDTVLESSASEDPFVQGDEFVPMRGLAYGFDVLLRQFESRDQRWNGWISYVYAVTRREHDGVRYFPGHDRRHNLNLVSSWRLGPYQLGARLGLASGTPYTEMTGQLVRREFNPATGTWQPPGAPPRNVDNLADTRNGARMPLTQRLDLNISRDYQRGRATIRPFLSVVNAYNAKNVWLYILDYGVAPPIRRTISQFPILPSVGVSVVF
jgi:hypothetical protein